MLRAMARIDSPASKNNRSTRWILRMDNLLEAIDMSSQKEARRMSRRRVIPRRALLHTRRPERFRPPRKSDRLDTGIGDRVRPASVIGLNRNR